MRSSLYCIMLSGASLPDRIANHLLQQAAIMFYDRKKRRSIKGDGFEGQVSTQFEIVLLGSTSGVLFKSTIDCGDSSLRVHFMVREAELREIIQGVLDLHSDELVGSLVTASEARRMAKVLEFPLPESPELN